MSFYDCFYIIFFFWVKENLFVELLSCGKLREGTGRIWYRKLRAQHKDDLLIKNTLQSTSTNQNILDIIAIVNFRYYIQKPTTITSDY